MIDLSANHAIDRDAKTINKPIDDLIIIVRAFPT